MADGWTSKPVICTGGLIESEDVLTRGSVLPGAARKLKNYEPALEGGYQRIKGYNKYSSTEVTGAGPILGVVVGVDGVWAARKDAGSTGVDVYYGTGSTWTKKTGSVRDVNAIKYRGIAYSITKKVVVFTDGVDYAWHHDGTTETTISGTGAPADPKYAAMHLNRLVLAGYSSNTSAISISAPNADTDFDASNGAIEINIGDTVVGLKVFRETLYVFCKNSIWKLTGNSNTNFLMQSVTRSIGCVSGDTIQEVGGDLIFLAPDGLRSIAATERIGDIDLAILSKNIQPSIRPLIGAYDENEFNSTVIRKKSQYRLFVYDENKADINVEGFIGKFTSNENFTGYEWAKTQGIHPYCCDSSYIGDDELVVFGDNDGGYVYRMESSNGFDGVDIDALYESPQITFEDSTIRKVLHRITLYTQVEGNIDVDLGLEFDFKGEGIQQPNVINITQSGTIATYGATTSTYGTAVYSALSLPVFKKNLIGSGFTSSFQFNSSGQDAPHRIDSFIVEYAVLGRR